MTIVDRLFGPYRLEGLVGRGGMGEVHRAFDTRRNRVVALKILRADLGDDEQFRSRFRREGQLAAQLQEPHIVPIHDFGEIDGALFIDMRLVPGQDAADVLERGGPMPVQRAAGLLGQIADALDAAHAAGVVHRDVKPSNILLLPSGFAYLVDFGIARAVMDGTTGLTGTGSTIGTMQYMAPEQFEGVQIDHRADVYALTCVLYELITGLPPFGRGNALTLMHAHLYAPPPRPTTVRPDIPPAIDDVIAHGMAKRPDDRFGTAGDLARAVQDAVVPGSGKVTDRTPEPARPKRRRRALIAAGITVAVTVVVIFTALTAWTVQRDGGQPAAETPGSASPSPSAAAPSTASDVPTAVDRELISILDPRLLAGCRRFEPKPSPAGSSPRSTASTWTRARNRVHPSCGSPPRRSSTSTSDASR